VERPQADEEIRGAWAMFRRELSSCLPGLTFLTMGRRQTVLGVVMVALTLGSCTGTP
jgi:hypothetical protein